MIWCIGQGHHFHEYLSVPRCAGGDPRNPVTESLQVAIAAGLTMTGQPVTLFEHFGVEVSANRAAASQQSSRIVAFLNGPCGAVWTVYSTLPESRFGGTSQTSAPADQGWLNWPEPTSLKLIAPVKSAFVNARALTFFAQSTRLLKAFARLQAQGILFVGDVAALSRADLTQRLGNYADCAHRVEDRLRAVGLALNARMPWWKRPTDFYD